MTRKVPKLVEVLFYLVSVSVCIGAVFMFAWLLDEPADNVVGWFALGLAASQMKGNDHD